MLRCDNFHTTNLIEPFLVVISDYEQLKLLTLKWNDDDRNMKELGREILENNDCLHEIKNFIDAIT